MLAEPIDLEESSNEERLEVVLHYVREGLGVIPLTPFGKTPFTPLLPLQGGKPSWKPLVVRRATEAEVRDWFARFPDINIGIATGEIVVVDYDTTDLPLPQTALVKTHRGYHAYFKTHQRIQGRKFDCIDLKADGGYVVAPPSRHSSGTTYHWLEGLPTFADLPEFDLTLLPQLPDESMSVVHESKKEDILSCSHSKVRAPIPYPELSRSYEVAEAIMALLRCEVHKGRTYSCPFHQPDKQPSASLYLPHDEGFISLHDFHTGEFWPLPDVYHYAVTGKATKLKKGERAIWWLRALDELRFIARPRISARKLPENAPEAAKKLYDGFVYSLELRKLYDPNQADVAPFAWRFAGEWCGGLSNNAVALGVAYLQNHGFIVKVGATTSRTSLYALGTAETTISTVPQSSSDVITLSPPGTLKS